jgi:hypothetical protein
MKTSNRHLVHEEDEVEEEEEEDVEEVDVDALVRDFFLVFCNFLGGKFRW